MGFEWVDGLNFCDGIFKISIFQFSKLYLSNLIFLWYAFGRFDKLHLSDLIDPDTEIRITGKFRWKQRFRFIKKISRRAAPCVLDLFLASYYYSFPFTSLHFTWARSHLILRLEKRSNYLFRCFRSSRRFRPCLHGGLLYNKQRV